MPTSSHSPDVLDLARNRTSGPSAWSTLWNSSGPISFAIPPRRRTRSSSGTCFCASAAKLAVTKARIASGVPASKAPSNAAIRRPWGVSGGAGIRAGARAATRKKVRAARGADFERCTMLSSTLRPPGGFAALSG